LLLHTPPHLFFDPGTSTHLPCGPPSLQTSNLAFTTAVLPVHTTSLDTSSHPSSSLGPQPSALIMCSLKFSTKVPACASVPPSPGYHRYCHCNSVCCDHLATCISICIEHGWDMRSSQTVPCRYWPQPLFTAILCPPRGRCQPGEASLRPHHCSVLSFGLLMWCPPVAGDSIASAPKFRNSSTRQASNFAQGLSLQAQD
jgi:hypothetical protein